MADEAMATLVDALGLSPEMASLALQKHNGNLEAAAQWALESQDGGQLAPPAPSSSTALVPVNSPQASPGAPPAAPAAPAPGPIHERPAAEHLEHAHGGADWRPAPRPDSNGPLIGPLLPLPDDKMTTYAAPDPPPLEPSSEPTASAAADESKEMQDALAQSLVEHTRIDAENAAQQLARMKPSARSRAVPARPVSMRTTSPLMSALAAAFLGLFAVQPLRDTVLSAATALPCTPATADDSAWTASFKNYWQGGNDRALEAITESLRQLNELAAATTPAEESEMHANAVTPVRLRSYARLFAFAFLSKRAFVSVDEFVRGLELTEGMFQPTPQPSVVFRFHFDKIMYDTAHAASVLQSLMPREASAGAGDDSAVRRLVSCDYTRVDERTALDEATASELTVEGMNMPLDVHVAPDVPDTLERALERSFLTLGDPPGMSCLLTLPDTLAFQIHRYVPAPHDSGVYAERHPFQCPERLSLGKFMYKNRRQAALGYQRLRKLREEHAALVAKRVELSSHEGTAALELFDDSITIVEAGAAAALDPDERDSQSQLAKSLRGMRDTTAAAIDECDRELQANVATQDSLFDGLADEGAYDLRALLFHNGLNGRSSAWAVVRSDEPNGGWWRVSDLDVNPTKLEDALRERSGLYMDCGLYAALYQRADYKADTESAIPAEYYLALTEDNEAFERELAQAREDDDW